MDVRHNVVASAIFESPFSHWAFRETTVSPVVSARSGVPFNLYLGSSVNGDTITTDRPFNAPRNSGQGPGFVSVDLRLTRRFLLPRTRAGMRAELIVEATNLLNRVNYLRVNDVIGLDPRYLDGPYDLKGRRGIAPSEPLAFSAAYPARQFQLGFRFVF